MSTEIKRFYVSAYDPGDGMLSISYETHRTGDCVKYADHERITNDLRMELLDALERLMAKDLE